MRRCTFRRATHPEPGSDRSGPARRAIRRSCRECQVPYADRIVARGHQSPIVGRKPNRVRRQTWPASPRGGAKVSDSKHIVARHALSRRAGAIGKTPKVGVAEQTKGGGPASVATSHSATPLPGCLRCWPPAAPLGRTRPCGSTNGRRRARRGSQHFPVRGVMSVTPFDPWSLFPTAAVRQVKTQRPRPGWQRTLVVRNRD
jgi:hypothetical protein